MKKTIPISMSFVYFVTIGDDYCHNWQKSCNASICIIEAKRTQCGNFKYYRPNALQTACTVALFLLSLVFATVSKVRSAPRTLCALWPRSHCTLRFQMQAFPLRWWASPAHQPHATWKKFSVFFCFPLDCACTKRSRKQKIRYPCVAMQFLFSLFIIPISSFIKRKIRSATKERQSKSLVAWNC